MNKHDNENYFGLDELMTSLKRVSSLHLTERGLFEYVFEGIHSIDGKEIAIEVALPKHFPTEKPMIFLKDPKGLGFMPHIEKDGFICYSHDEGLLLDESNPFGIVREAFIRADKTLKEGIRKDNIEEFLKEFEVLWARQENCRLAESLFSPNDSFEKVNMLIDERTNKIVITNRKSEETTRQLNTLYKCNVEKEFTQYDGVHVPFRKNSKVKPPSYWNFWSTKTLRKIVFSNITGSTKKKLEDYLDKTIINESDKKVLLFSIPVGDGERIFFGVLLEDFKSDRTFKKTFPFVHPLKKTDCSFSLIPLYLKRYNQDYLLNRTQGQNKLIGKKATIMGMGSLGSRIAVELARAGVSSFLFIDKDVLDIDNVYRHELGVSSLYHRGTDIFYKMPKTEAMKRKLLEQFPSLDIDYETMDVLELEEKDKQKIMKSNIVISALGSSTVELALNKEFYETEGYPPVVYTWIDPLGLGGHALVTNNRSKEGCFRCLYTDITNNNIMVPNRASFAAPNQVFAKTITGCDSVFTPYGSIDAMQTAALASRLAIKVLSETEVGNPLLSWKGESDEVLEQGKEVSTRYSFTSEQLHDARYNYHVINCPVCGGGEGNEI